MFKRFFAGQRTGRRLRYGAAATVLLVSALAVLLILNILMTRLEDKHGWRTDMSWNSLTSYGADTQKVLDSLTVPVHVYAVYQEDAYLLALLDRYAANCPNFTWEKTNLALNPGLVSRFRAATPEESIGADSLVFWCEATGRFKAVPFAQMLNYTFDEEGSVVYEGLQYERVLSSAITYVAAEQIPRVMILQGHGELSEGMTVLLADLLDRSFRDVYYFTLNAQGITLEPDDLLLILSPERDFTDSETEQLLAFAEAGGSMLLTCDYSDPVERMPNWQSLLRLYGFLPEPTGTVVCASAEEPGSYLDPYRYMLLPSVKYTGATQALAANTALLFPAARGFTVPTEADSYLSTDVLVSSAEGAFLTDMTADLSSSGEPLPGSRGPYALGLLAERITGKAERSQAAVLGSSAVLTEEWIWARTDTETFLASLVGWLQPNRSDLPVAPRSAVRPQLTVGSLGAGTVVIFLLPVLAAAAALLVLGYRRKL